MPDIGFSKNAYLAIASEGMYSDDPLFYELKENPLLLRAGSTLLDENQHRSLYVTTVGNYYIKYLVTKADNNIIVVSFHRLTNDHEDIEMSVSAEAEIINPLFNEHYFSSIREELKAYSTESDYDKKVTMIIKIMNKLWKEKHKKHYVSDLFSVTEKFEDILLWLGVRDHFIHQFETFLLGSYVLTKWKSKLLSIISEKHQCLQDIDDLIFTWLLTSTVHDFGYPAYKAKALNENLHDLFQNLDFAELADTYGELANHIQAAGLEKVVVAQDGYEEVSINITRLLARRIVDNRLISGTEDQAVSILKEVLDKVDHGCVSAYLLVRKVIMSLHTLIPWHEYKERKDFIQLQEAALGILFHTIHNRNIKTISFYENPIVALMIIVDELQEWGRKSNKNRKYSLSLEKVKFHGEQIVMLYKPIFLGRLENVRALQSEVMAGWKAKRKILRKIKPADFSANLSIKAVLLPIDERSKKVSEITIHLAKRAT